MQALELSQPQFIKNLKDSDERFGTLQNELDEQKARLVQAKVYLRSSKLTQQELLEASLSLAEIVDNIDRISAEIRSISVESIMTIEGKLAGISATIETLYQENAMGDAMPPREIIITPWEQYLPDDPRISITTNDLWFMQLASKLFGASPKEIMKP